MTSTFTTNVNMEVPARGDYVATWDTPLDGWATALDAIRGGTTTLNLASTTPIALTQTQHNAMRIVCQGTLTANIVVNFLSGKGGRWVVVNNTTGAFSVTFGSAGGGSSVVVTQGATTELLHDGTNVVSLTVSTGVPTTRLVSAGTMLSGGGDLSADRTISLAALSAAGMLIGSPAGSTTPQAITLGSGLSMTGSTISATTGGTGTVTQVNTGTYLTGGPITGSGTINMGAMGGNGRLLGSSASAAAITDITLGTGLSIATTVLSNSGVTALTGGTGLGVSASTGSVSLSNTGVTSNVAGTGISVSGATGAVTITNTGVTSVTAGTGITTSGSTGGVTIYNNGVTGLFAGTGISVSAASGNVTVSATGGITQGTAVNTTSGTAIDFTGIPSTAKRVTFAFNGVSLSSTGVLLIQIGNGSMVTTGYTNGGGNVANGSASFGTNPSTGFLIGQSSIASDALSGAATIVNVSGNIWAFSANLSCAGSMRLGAGVLSLSGTLDRVRITSSSGTDTFDAGSVNIMWE